MISRNRSHFRNCLLGPGPDPPVNSYVRPNGSKLLRSVLLTREVTRGGKKIELLDLPERMNPRGVLAAQRH
jgi:hypothetical protein